MGRIFEFALTLNTMVQGNMAIQAGRVSNSLRQLEIESQRLRREYSQQENELSRINSLLNQNTNRERQLQSMYESGAISAERYTRALNGLRQNRERFNNMHASTENSMSNIQQQRERVSRQQRFTSASDDFSGAMNNVQSNAAKLATTIGTITSLASPFIDATKAAIGFESAMADVNKVVDFDGAAELKEMNDGIIQMTRNIPMAAEDIAKIVAAGGQAGIAKEELLGFAESAAKMGVAFDITAEQAGDTMAKWRTAFGMNQKEVIDLADKVNYLGNTTAAAAPLISDVLTRIGPLGDVGGVASGEIAALGASMIGVGIPSEVAATGIKNMILGLVAGESATKSQSEAFNRLGLDASDMAKRMQVDAKGAIVDVLERIKSLDEAEQASILKQLFGSESLSAIAPLLSNLDNLKDNLNKVADAEKYAGSMEAEYAARSATTENSIQLMKNAVTELGIKVGSVFLPAIKDSVSVLAEYGGKLAEIAGEHPNLIMGITAVGAAIAGMVVAGQTVALISSSYTALTAAITACRNAEILASAASKIHAVATTIMTAVTGGATAAFGTLNAVLTANPIGAVVVAVMALIGALVYFYNTNETVREIVDSVWNTLQTIVSSAITAIISFVNGLSTAVPAAIDGAMQAAYNVMSSAFDGLMSVVDSGVNQIKSLWGSLISSVSTPIATVVNFITGGGGEVAHNARGGIYQKGAFLTTFAEEGPEAAIPLDGSQRAKDLWYTAGNIMGLMPSGKNQGNYWSVLDNLSSGNSITNNNNNDSLTQNISISVPVTINGNADNSVVNTVQNNIVDVVKRAIADIQNQQRRVSFA